MMKCIPLNLYAQWSRANNRRKRNGAKNGASCCLSLEPALVTASKVRAWNKRYLIFKQDERNTEGCVQSTSPPGEPEFTPVLIL